MSFSPFPSLEAETRAEQNSCFFKSEDPPRAPSAFNAESALLQCGPFEVQHHSLIIDMPRRMSRCLQMYDVKCCTDDPIAASTLLQLSPWRAASLSVTAPNQAPTAQDKLIRWLAMLSGVFGRTKGYAVLRYARCRTSGCLLRPAASCMPACLPSLL